MRSPGASRMIQIRTFSLSDSSVEPTQPLLLSRSRSNSSAMALGHADLSAWSVVLSSMVRAIAFLQVFLQVMDRGSCPGCCHIIENLSSGGNSGDWARIGQGFANG